MLGRLKFNLTELANEMLDNIPEEYFSSSTTTFLDPAMAGGQFVKAVVDRLRKYGHTDKNISTRVYGFESNKMRVAFAAKQCYNVGTFNTKDFLKEDIDMKFDVVIGNPPFNDSVGDSRTEAKNTNNSNLYVDFIEKCLKIVNNGQVALITPAAWMNNDKIKEKVIESGLRKVKYIDPKHFPGVGIRSGISCLFTETGYDDDVDIETEETVYTIHRHSTLTFDNPEKFDIIDTINENKASFASLLKTGSYKIPKGTKGSIDRLLEKDNSFSQNKDNIYDTQVIIYAGGKDTAERYLYSDANMTQDKWGVVVPTASDKYMIGAVRLIEPGIGVSDRLKVAYFDTETEAKNVKAYLESKLVRFIVGTTKHNDTVNTNKNSFGNIPLIDFTVSRTDQELFDLFELSVEEIALVNV